MKKLVLLSGGRDSLLSVCLVTNKSTSVNNSTEDKEEIILAFCNNGHIEGKERVNIVVQILKEKYGKDKISNLTEFHTGMTLQYFLNKIWRYTSKELASQYPDLQIYQIHCLACKISMYVHTIAYCKKNDIGIIIDGMRESQGFFVDSPEFREIVSKLCIENNIQLYTPVYNLVSDQDRKRMLCDRGMPTKTFEPQCFLGCPILNGLTIQQKESLLLFFKNEMQDLIQPYIDELIL